MWLDLYQQSCHGCCHCLRPSIPRDNGNTGCSVHGWGVLLAKSAHNTMGIIQRKCTFAKSLTYMDGCSAVYVWGMNIIVDIPWLFWSQILAVVLVHVQVTLGKRSIKVPHTKQAIVVPIVSRACVCVCVWPMCPFCDRTERSRRDSVQNLQSELVAQRRNVPWHRVFGINFWDTVFMNTIYVTTVL